jgi:tetratricopeptide (TPR) repeat protein
MNVPGRLNDVIAQYQEAVRLKPDYVEARVNLGNALYVAGRLNEAVVQFGETLRLRPDFADAHFNLAMALLNLPGRAAEARTHLEAVLRLQPGNQEAAQLLAKLRSGRP